MYPNFGILYIVSVPIGNMEDLTLRAKRILMEVGGVLCEDTRKSGILFSRLGFKPQLISFYAHNQNKRLPLVIRRLKKGEDLALITDSGTPCISDPGSILVNECRNEGIDVIPVPGASSPITAYSVSGFPPLPFVFLGFLSPKSGKRKKELEKWHRENFLVIVLESPHRLIKLLEDALTVYGNCMAFVAHEMTKSYESYHRGTLLELLGYWQENRPKGEFTLIFWSEKQKMSTI